MMSSFVSDVEGNFLVLRGADADTNLQLVAAAIMQLLDSIVEVQRLTGPDSTLFSDFDKLLGKILHFCLSQEHHDATEPGSKLTRLWQWGDSDSESEQSAEEETEDPSSDVEARCKGGFARLLDVLCVGSHDRTERLIAHTHRHHIYLPRATRQWGCKGIINVGNTCYALSVIQALYASTAFTGALLELDDVAASGNVIETPTMTKTPLLDELRHVFALLCKGCKSTVYVNDLLRVFYAKFRPDTGDDQGKAGVLAANEVSFTGVAKHESTAGLRAGKQNDAVEFFTEFTNLLRKECIDGRATDVTRTFQGTSRIILEDFEPRTGNAGSIENPPVNVREKQENFIVLTLDTSSVKRVMDESAPHEVGSGTVLEKALYERQQRKQIRRCGVVESLDDQGEQLDSCAGSISSGILTTVRSVPDLWPQHLLIQPRRLAFDRDSLCKRKLLNSEAEFSFPDVLDLEFLDRGTSNLVYKLQSVIIHSGTASEGHYWTYNKLLGTSKWALLDDDVVTVCDARRVFCEAASAVSIPSCPGDSAPALGGSGIDAGDSDHSENGSDDGTDEADWVVDDLTNAYLLFYALDSGAKAATVQMSTELFAWTQQRNLSDCVAIMLE